MADSDAVREADHLLALQGLAALRAAAGGDEGLAAQRLQALREAAAREPPPGDRARLLPRVDPGEGYAAWAATYDDHDNATIAAARHP